MNFLTLNLSKIAGRKGKTLLRNHQILSDVFLTPYAPDRVAKPFPY
jgi:hypothetical protein